MTNGGHVGSIRELPRGARLSVEIKKIEIKEVLPHSGCEKKYRNRGRFAFGNRCEGEGTGPNVKVYQSSMYEASPKGKNIQCSTQIKKVQPFR